MIPELQLELKLWLKSGSPQTKVFENFRKWSIFAQEFKFVKLCKNCDDIMNYQLKKPLTFDLKVKYNEIDKFLYPKLNK